MRNKGFTLIELLAVIVILAIIALIATPIILGIINDTKKEASKRSVEMYAKAVENAIMSYQMKENKMPTTYEDIKEYIKYDGQEITVDRLDIYEDGSIYIEGIKSKEELLAKSYGTKQRYTDGEEVYIDVTTGKSCTNYHADNSITGYNGITTTKTTDNQNSCLKFYAFLDDGSNKINLLLDHNTTAKLAWTTSEIGTNANGPVDVINKLKTDTNEWVGTITLANYEYKGTARPYTIDYSGYKARLITAQEIAKITGADKLLSWDEISTTSGSYYLDGAKTNETVPNWQTQVANSTNKSDYYWLFDRTKSCTSYGCQVADGSTYGYWTSSARASYSTHAWFVYYGGRLGNTNVHATIYYGVRPVIIILKSNI